MSPRDVYPEGNVMWQRAGESWADAVVQEAGEGDGELEGSQEPSTAHIPDPSITSHSRAVRRERERDEESETTSFGLISKDNTRRKRWQEGLSLAGHGEFTAVGQKCNPRTLTEKPGGLTHSRECRGHFKGFIPKESPGRLGKKMQVSPSFHDKRTLDVSS